MRRLDIDWPKTIAGALAAVVSAVLLSTLGAAGTLVGAALGSLIVTVSSAVFAQGLATSKETLSKAQARALQKVGVAQADVERAGHVQDPAVRADQVEQAQQRLAAANRELDDAGRGGRGSLGDRLRALPWRRILLVSGALFVAAMVVITVFELAVGRSVSSITGGSSGGGTTIGDVSDDGGRDRRQDRDRDDEQPPEGPTSPGQGPSPSDRSTPEESPTPTAPTTQTPSPQETTPPELEEEPAPSAS